MQFNTGDIIQTRTIIINQDQLCEDDPNEFFLFRTFSGLQTTVEVIHSYANVSINDILEPECSESTSFF